MTDPELLSGDGFLEQVQILIPRRRKPISLRAVPRLGGNGTAGGSRLENEALRWTYVLRSRERWLTNRSSQAQHEEQARNTLLDFNVGELQLAEIGAAENVVVRMPYRIETEG